MIASIKVWMTKELPGISENGSGVGSIFTSGVFMFEEIFQQVCFNPYIIDLYGF